MSLRAIIPILLLSTSNAFPQQKTTLTYSVKGSDTLKMDIYSNQDIQEKKPCVLFVFGGGFFMGQRDADYYAVYFNELVQHNYKVITIDYRLGLKGNKKKISPLNTKPLKEAIEMAVTDLYDATAYLIKNEDKLGIDTSMMMLSGSSAGGITVLHADWEKRNHTDITSQLPEDFQYKAVLSFAGAILSYKGKPSYKIPPAPTMLFHGTEDKVVIYNKIRLFNKGFFGSKALAKRFRQKKYPYYFERVEGMGHEVAGSPMKENLDDILWFIDAYVYKKKQYLIEVDFNDLQRKRTFNMRPVQ
ncbi:alpha/beta hydrolase fold domain-containing protein [Chitinophaga oryziterrae]|uniref:Alpha/beta hydrolase fold domain-containing protein n=1 Tax=Chitinophaga oryziterrae TaxID=1031224 RepID=A0A6N8J976_9BACT|nr:carboxylesterase family protein [Chitinophaga oryziterrae]MVT41673.1 alpha/beta hydrolase fold domain-containing protein [Chitinophaga oryziterrae]